APPAAVSAPLTRLERQRDPPPFHDPGLLGGVDADDGRPPLRIEHRYLPDCYLIEEYRSIVVLGWGGGGGSLAEGGGWRREGRMSAGRPEFWVYLPQMRMSFSTIGE